MANQTVTLEEFADMVAFEGLTPEERAVILSIIADISTETRSFQANSPELVQLAARHSPVFQALPAGQQAFYASVLTMEILFY